MLCRWNGAELDYNQDDARQTVVNWIDGTAGTSAAFDFPTKGILQEAVKNCEYWRLRDQNGKPPGVIGYYPKRAVTFIDNHDTGPPSLLTLPLPSHRHPPWSWLACTSQHQRPQQSSSQLFSALSAPQHKLWICFCL